MPMIGDYLPGISAAIADVAKTRAAVEAMRFDKLVQIARLKQQAKSEQEYMAFEQQRTETKNRMDTAQEDLRFQHELKLIEARTAGNIQEINQRAAQEALLAKKTGNTEAARNALLAAQTQVALEGVKLDYYQVMSKPLATFWQERGITPDLATEADKSAYNTMVDEYNSWAAANGFPTRAKLSTAPVPPPDKDILSKLPPAPSFGGVFNYLGGKVSGAVDWWSNLGAKNRGGAGGEY